MPSNLLKLIMIGLIFGLTACRSATANQPPPVQQAPTEAAPPAVEAKMEATPAQAPAPSELAEEPAAVATMVEVTEQPIATVETTPAATAEAAPIETAPALPTIEPERPIDKPIAKVEETGPDTPVKAETMRQETNPTEFGPTPAQAQLLAGLGSRGQAPELDNEVWLNSDPLKLAHLQGKVVLIEFWTFG